MSQAEKVARVMVPVINVLAILVYPIGSLMQVRFPAKMEQIIFAYNNILGDVWLWVGVS